MDCMFWFEPRSERSIYLYEELLSQWKTNRRHGRGRLDGSAPKRCDCAHMLSRKIVSILCCVYYCVMVPAAVITDARTLCAYVCAEYWRRSRRYIRTHGEGATEGVQEKGSKSSHHRFGLGLEIKGYENKLHVVHCNPSCWGIRSFRRGKKHGKNDIRGLNTSLRVFSSTICWSRETS